MIRALTTITICVGFLIACNNQSATAVQDDTIGNNEIAMRPSTGLLPGAYCYSYSNKDSVALNINVADSNVTGSLRYNLYEKDKNNGTISGKLKGDTLLADYTFMAEGMQSVREVAFILTDSTAKEGYGEMKEENNKSTFINTTNLSFGKSFILHKQPCE